MFDALSPTLFAEYLQMERDRVLPLDAPIEDKFHADMVLIEVGSFGEDRGYYARGYIFNDSRGVFRNAEIVRTSTIKQIHSAEGVEYIETRNAVYRVIGLIE